MTQTASAWMTDEPPRAFLTAVHPDVPDALTGAAVAIGNFDGMHRGHQAVFESVRAVADARGLPAVAVTFEPHPRDVFGRGGPVFRLTPPAAKARVAAAVGLDGLVTVPFDLGFASTPADGFVGDLLVRDLAVRHAAVGWNFNYGAGRAGTAETLGAAGSEHGFTVEIAPCFTAEDGEPVSSSRIRDLLAEGDMAGAAGLLGYRWFFDAVVVDGDKRGRTIGYPTANTRLPDSARLRHGVYAVVIRIDGVARHGVASHGRRPTFDDGAPVFETFVFDFEGSLYGKTVTVTPVARLRDELKFDGVPALVAQMDLDSAEARALLSGLAPISPLDRSLTFD